MTMLVNPTITKLDMLGLTAMAAALAEQLATPGAWTELDFCDRLGLLVDRETDARDTRRLATRLKTAKLRYPACVEDLDLRAPRGLQRAEMLQLAQASWVAHHHNLVITGATGCGKTFVACALTNAALRAGHTGYYTRTPRLLDQLAVGRADGRHARLLTHLARVSVLVLDDFLLSPASTEACRDLLEVVEDRAQRRSTIVVSQLPVDNWHAAMADPTLADALLDRVLQASHRITMKGPSRRQRDPVTPAAADTPVVAAAADLPSERR
jgi:DNA replication protein DnaC